MFNVNGSSPRGQADALRDFHGQDFEEDEKVADLIDSSSNEKHISPGEALSLVEGKTPFTILYILDKVYPKKLQASELHKISDIHRTTISGHCKTLYELGVIKRDYLSGTEKKVNPTYLFSVPEDLRKNLVNFLQLKLDLYPSVTELNLGKESEIFESVPDVEIAPDAEPKPREIDIYDQKFEQIRIIITKMAKEIESLHQKISDLENKEDLKQNTELDFSEALDALGIDLGGSK